MDLHLHDLAYQRKIGHLIEVLDQPDFWGQLVRGVRSFIDFDNWVVLCFSPAGPPQVSVRTRAPTAAPTCCSWTT